MHFLFVIVGCGDGGRTDSEKVVRAETGDTGVEDSSDTDTAAPCDTASVLGWADGDGDGYGDPDRLVRCAGTTSVDNDDDCNDDDASVHPDAPETCDGIDQDCDGIDEGDACGIAGSHTLPEAALQVVDASQVSFGDFNDDGKKDLVGGNAFGGGSSTLYVWLAPFDGRREPGNAWMTVEPDDAEAYFGIGVLAGRDLDGDGTEDVAVGSRENNGTVPGTVYVFTPAAGTYALGDVVAAQFEADGDGASTGENISAADADGDGDADLLLDSWRLGAAWILEGPLPHGTMSDADAMLTVTGDGLGECSTFGDLDGDGLAEVAVGSRETIYVVAGGTRGEVRDDDADASIAPWVEDAYSLELAVGDLDGDGNGDLVTNWRAYDSDYGQLFVLSGPLVGALTTSDASASYFGPIGDSATGDIDGDGQEDLAIALADGIFYSNDVVLLGPLLGAVSEDDAYGVIGLGGSRTTSVAIGDTNADGYGDLMLGGTPGYLMLGP